ncbi:MAG: hypothetical protein RLZZ308_67 [Candidatus Parcubacteria bacterium]|jgi:trigger factor
MKFEKKDLPKSQIEIRVSLDTEEFDSYHAKAFQAVQKEVEVDGFRKGNAPEHIVIQKYGEMIIVEEMANLALRDAYMKAIDEHKINPIAQPEIAITKIAKGNPFEATMTISIMPEITLPKYTTIAEGVMKDGETVEVTDTDINDVVEELRKGRAGHAHHDHDHDHNHHDHSHDEVTAESDNKKEENLPVVDDAFAQSFGEDFKTVADLKEKIGANLKLEKEQKLREKRRTAIIDKITAETKVDLPEVVIEGELDTMLSQMKHDITRFGGTWEEYLAHMKKTEDEIKAGWRDDAIKRSLSQLILHKIAHVENLQATEAEIEAELVRLLATVQDADEDRAKGYLYQVITNDKVLRFLEEGTK